MPKIILVLIYERDNRYFPFCSICKFSILNAEKVVKPPQIPVARNNFQLLEKPACFILSPITIPITRLPAIFTRRVGTGKSGDLNKYHVI